MAYLKVTPAPFGSTLVEMTEAAAKAALAAHTAFPVGGRILVDRTWFASQAGLPPPITLPVVPTGATAGTPGSFVPAGATPPANLAALQALGALGQTTAWTTGQSIKLGDNSSAYWDGTKWAAGAAPAVTPPAPPPAPPAPPPSPPAPCPPEADDSSKTVAKAMRASEDALVVELEEPSADEDAPKRKVRVKRGTYVAKDEQPAKRKLGRPRKQKADDTPAK